MSKIILALALILIAIPMLAQHCGSCPSVATAQASVQQTNAPKLILKAKTAQWLDKQHYVTYEWSKNPKIGTYILLVNVFDKNKKRLTDVSVTANAYMPSMKGSHDTGDKKMQLNRKKQFAIPVNFMMLGDWEIELKFSKAGKLINNAFVQLDIN